MSVLELSDEEKKYLLQLARHTLKKIFNPRLEEFPPPPSPKLKEKYGVFVTLHEHGQLRGCIGLVEGIKPLYEAVEDMTISAALRDPRFPPLSEEEVPEVEIEISVLSPLRKIDDVNEIEVGKHGIFIVRNGYRGLLLPQVATEWGWDREQFLDQTCLKAGMYPGCWKEEGTEIYIFSAEIFDEKEFNLLPA